MKAALNCIHRRSVRVAVTTVAALVGTMGCGSNGTDPQHASQVDEEQRVRVVLDQMAVHLQRNDSSAACNLMTRAGQKRFIRQAQLWSRSTPPDQRPVGTCPMVLASMLSEQTLLEDLRPRIVSLRIQDGRAHVVADVSHGRTHQTAVLEKENGEWRVATWFAN